MAVAKEIEDVVRAMVRHQHDHPPVRDLNHEMDRRQTAGERLAEDLARMIGSWWFLAAQSVVVVTWIVLNAVAAARHWDGYPFLFLNLILGLEAAYAVALVLMALNRRAFRDRLRAEHEYELNVKLEEELRSIMSHLENQDDVLVSGLERLERLEANLLRLSRRLEPEEIG
ncbi:MAG: DUF1003 domain-containing protein [Candidatus Dormibacteraceae bacterium]